MESFAATHHHPRLSTQSPFVSRIHIRASTSIRCLKPLISLVDVLPVTLFTLRLAWNSAPAWPRSLYRDPTLRSSFKSSLIC